ncbi:hypothetical protein D3C71_1642310 [compost metagenome]
MGADVGGTAKGGKHRLRSRKVFRPPAHKDGEGSVFGAHRTAGHRCIQVGQTHFPQSRRMVAGFTGLDGCHVDKQCALAHGLRSAHLKQHVPHH